ncbi:MAG TPA: zinc-binding dehydrogenase [Verrucomicrobiae bacterium]|jgi:propanol-preferring alcohol dehydrogenase|nr:zinc-binding dehydrogenase [Verrucomicrobiae bacterium]
MRAIRLAQAGQPLQAQDIPTPEPGPDDVLIRVRAAGVCRSDAHYRAGVSPVAELPMTLGHEIAGEAAELGANVKHISTGARVCVHYMATCGHCAFCFRGLEQFCVTGRMIGKHRAGGYAEYVCVPARSVFLLPEEIPFAHGAVMMCSSATSLHALLKARLRAGETVALFGFGGLGFSAAQLARALGAGQVFAVDVQPAKLRRAAQLGATPIQPTDGDAAGQIKAATGGRGVDVALELIGLPATMDGAVRSLAIQGRAALVGLTAQTFPVAPYRDVINKEAEIIGVSDHLASEIPLLLDLARAGKLRFPPDAIRMIPLEAGAVNQALDDLEAGTDQIRAVITP